MSKGREAGKEGRPGRLEGRGDWEEVGWKREVTVSMAEPRGTWERIWMLAKRRLSALGAGCFAKH